MHSFGSLGSMHFKTNLTDRDVDSSNSMTNGHLLNLNNRDDVSNGVGLSSPSSITESLFNGKLRNNLFEGAQSDSFSQGQDLGNLGLSMWNNSSTNPVLQGAEPGGASMGATVPESHMISVIEQVLKRMGINAQHSVFNPNQNPALMGAFSDGMSGALTNRSVESQPFPAMSNTPQSYNQLGSNFGQNLNVNLANTAINSCVTNGTNNTIGGDKDTREMIGQYMDQHQNVYSKPETSDGKDTNWKTALSNQDQLSQNSLALVNIARQDLVSALEGGNVGANHPGKDVSHAMMNADAGQTNIMIAQQQRQLFMTV